ncbi:MAG: hypothetical protein ACTSVI_01880 [Promethearchaeota archaeon]
MKFVIIGNGIAGSTVASNLRALDDNAEIFILSTEPRGYYSRIWLPEIISGEKTANEIIPRDVAWYEKKN